jgi:hypothetical protein
MSYGDARYQTKRISVGGLKASSGMPSNSSTPTPSLESAGSSSSSAYLQSGPIPAKPIQTNAYAASQKIRTFTEPIPDSDPQPPAPEFSYSQPEAAPQTTNSQHLGATRIYELAEKYVSVFQSHAAAQMTPEQRQALVVEVATFYSAPFRAGRLEALVSAFDV